jgi:glycosyltransferase involved in cell wall biosynthesis
VNVIGYLEAELGLGEIGRKIVDAAERSGIPTATVIFRRTHSRQEHRFEQRGPADAPYDTNIICVNADGLHLVRDAFGSALFAGRYSIGVWFWELGYFPPSQHQAFHLVDEVWVASPFVREAIAAQTHKPVLVVPIPLEPPAIQARTRAELGLPDSFVFLFSFDFFSVMERKNPLGLVEAFCRAFGSGEGPTLVIKTINGERKPPALNKLRNAASDRSDIRIVDGYVAPEERDALMAACDCYVSLHRSEGLGLTMAEAMSLGKPVIATGYSGNLAFMDADNSYLVRYTLGTVPEGCDPYPQGVEWAEPDLDHAAELMRRVYERPDEAGVLGERGREAILKRHTVSRTAEFIRKRFEEIPHHPELLRYVRGPLEEAASISAKPPGASIATGKGRSPTTLLRALLRRALWPEFAEQRRLDAAVIDSLRGLEQVIRSESKRIGELERRIDSAEND